jgi:hypothetical protein
MTTYKCQICLLTMGHAPSCVIGQRNYLEAIVKARDAKIADLEAENARLKAQSYSHDDFVNDHT